MGRRKRCGRHKGGLAGLGDMGQLIARNLASWAGSFRSMTWPPPAWNRSRRWAPPSPAHLAEAAEGGYPLHLRGQCEPGGRGPVRPGRRGRDPAPRQRRDRSQHHRLIGTDDQSDVACWENRR